MDAEKLTAHGITSIGDLLRAGATAEGRHDLAASTGISGALIHRWVVDAALFHLVGVAKERSVALDAAEACPAIEVTHSNPTISSPHERVSEE